MHLCGLYKKRCHIKRTKNGTQQEESLKYRGKWIHRVDRTGSDRPFELWANYEAHSLRNRQTYKETLKEGGRNWKGMASLLLANEDDSDDRNNLTFLNIVNICRIS
jgi:hypothetical protein